MVEAHIQKCTCSQKLSNRNLHKEKESFKSLSLKKGKQKGKEERKQEIISQDSKNSNLLQTSRYNQLYIVSAS